MVHAAYVWVDDDRDLDRAAQRLSKASALAVDTEADSFYHYHHKCCLIQISDGETVYLVDPLALKRLEPLGEALGAKRIVKVLHAAEQDVLYLRRDFGFHLEPLFDTMIASQLLGKSGIGLASLLLASFGVKLDKGSQREEGARRGGRAQRDARRHPAGATPNRIRRSRSGARGAPDARSRTAIAPPRPAAQEILRVAGAARAPAGVAQSARRRAGSRSRCP